MLSSIHHSLRSLEEALQNKKVDWEAGPLIISVLKSAESAGDELMEIDLATTIGFDVLKPKKLTNDSVYWLPYKVNDEVTRNQVIKPIISNMCRNNGFNVLGTYLKNESKYYFTCNRSLCHREGTNNRNNAKHHHPNAQPSSRDKKTSRPIVEEGDKRCKFKFNMFWDDNRKQWYFPKQQAGSIIHSGHSKLLPIELKKDSRRLSQTLFYM
jgi:hypothetical protein